MTKVVILGSAKNVDATAGSSLLETLQTHRLPISTSCGGVATCALCRVTVKRGKEFLSPLNEREILHLGTIAKIVGLRLACQARVTGEGEVEIDVPPVEDIAAKKQAKADRLRAQRALHPKRS